MKDLNRAIRKLDEIARRFLSEENLKGLFLCKAEVAELTAKRLAEIVRGVSVGSAIPVVAALQFVADYLRPIESFDVEEEKIFLSYLKEITSAERVVIDMNKVKESLGGNNDESSNS